MIPETEAEIYEFIIKDGKDMDSLRRNTQTLRDQLVEEEEKRVLALSKIDPQNKERHEREAARIFEEKSRKLDEVLMGIAENSTVKKPLPDDVITGASRALTGSRKLASYVKTFVATYIGTTILMFILIYVIRNVTSDPTLPQATSTYDDTINLWLHVGVPLFVAFMVTVGKKHK